MAREGDLRQMPQNVPKHRRASDSSKAAAPMRRRRIRHV